MNPIVFLWNLTDIKMARTIKYRIVEVVKKTRLSNERTYLIIQRKKFFWWISKKIITKLREFKDIESAVEYIKHWHQMDYGEKYTKKKVVKSIEFQVGNWN